MPAGSSIQLAVKDPKNPDKIIEGYYTPITPIATKGKIEIVIKTYPPNPKDAVPGKGLSDALNKGIN